MSTRHHDTASPAEHPATAAPGYEVEDARAGATYRAGLWVLGTMVGAALLVVPLFALLGRHEARTQPAPASRVTSTPVAAPAFPKLLVSEPQALAEHRRQEDELLHGWGWVEKDRGVARIPIAEALRLVGERGVLPAFATEASPLGAVPPPDATASRDQRPAGVGGDR